MLAFLAEGTDHTERYMLTEKACPAEGTCSNRPKADTEDTAEGSKPAEMVHIRELEGSVYNKGHEGDMVGPALCRKGVRRRR